ncbi:MAG: hypothetical protein R2724_22945 [Bryobacterales bacterium]
MVPPALAYGLHRPDRVLHFKRTTVPLLPGAVAEPIHPGLFTTIESADSIVTEDYNHPLAGKDLEFEITLALIEGAAD